MTNPMYNRLRETAQRLIDTYGKAGSIVREERSGPPHAPVVTPVAHSCRLVDTGYSLTNRDASVVQVGDKVGVLSPDVPVEPGLHDRLRIDGTDYRLVDLQPLDPGGVTLLFEYVARI
ncbi:hypothetical protein [Coralloluteibacterium thermophilus]|uniref:Uncharacterized protein n=1 Tax=Coralloluteibacterium thermophilum TaxID=2707049 RepID=A0ABV9NLU1_9GAMM